MSKNIKMNSFIYLFEYKDELLKYYYLCFFFFLFLKKNT